MNIRKCRKCGKVYQYIRSPFCPACMESIDQQYRQIRDYLDEHPKAQIPQLASETDVSESTILYLLREGRLTLNTGSINCERCKEPIDSGRYCGSCMSLLHKGLTEITKAGESSQSKPAESLTASNRQTARQAHTSFNKADEHDSGMHIHRKNRRT